MICIPNYFASLDNGWQRGWFKIAPQKRKALLNRIDVLSAILWSTNTKLTPPGRQEPLERKNPTCRYQLPIHPRTVDEFEALTTTQATKH